MFFNVARNEWMAKEDVIVPEALHCHSSQHTEAPSLDLVAKSFDVNNGVHIVMISDHQN